MTESSSWSLDISTDIFQEYYNDSDDEYLPEEDVDEICSLEGLFFSTRTGNRLQLLTGGGGALVTVRVERTWPIAPGPLTRD